MPGLADLRVQLFGDGADITSIRALADDPRIAGFTTNPTLMRAAGVSDYAVFAQHAIAAAASRPISFEVISDDFATMADQAREIASWGPNIFVKIPVTDTNGRTSAPIIEELVRDGVQINVTALMTLAQVTHVAPLLGSGTPAFVSIFAGRIADTGRDPMPILRSAVEILEPYPNVRLIWASPRELLNVFQADAVGCHVITMTNDLIKKLPLIGKDLTEYSHETVRMFYEDAKRSAFTIPVREVALRR